MNRNEHDLRNLLFLISLGTVATGCGEESGDRGSFPVSSSSASAGSSATSGNDGDDDGGDTGKGDDDGDEDDDDGTPPSGGDSDDGAPPSDDDAGDDGDDTGIGDIDPACETYGNVIEQCFPGEGAQAAMECQSELEYALDDGPECQSAAEELFACLSALSCEAIETEEACADVDFSACPDDGGTGGR